MTNLPAKIGHGKLLLELPEYNKGTAFTYRERCENGLLGMMPYSQESLSLQVDRAYRAYTRKDSDLEKHIFLRQLQSINETLFFQLIIDHSIEMLPVIYTPTVGQACELFSEIYRKPFGLFLNYMEKQHMEQILNNVAKDDIDIIVITDGEAILGIGDQGVGGMGIPIGKLNLYSALGGIDPQKTLPIILDVGTDNEKLLNSGFYVGWKHPRIRHQEYDDFVELALSSIHKKWPHAVIQFEDFAATNALRILEKYAHRLCCFNDDIQGTAAVTVGSLIAASRRSGHPLKDSNFVILGAGAAGVGIAGGITAQLVSEGLDVQAARRRIYMLNRHGLIRRDSSSLRPQQQPFAQSSDHLNDWQGDDGLMSVVRNIKPEILIGVSGQPNYFSEDIVREMAKHCQHPCIFPLSNPTSKTEAVPSDLLKWTDGRSIVATGSPFEAVHYGGVRYEIAQCNNAYAFPGIGLGLSAAKVKRLTEEMLNAVASVIGNAQTSFEQVGSSILPPLDSIRDLSRKIAIEIVTIAMQQNLTECQLRGTVAEMIDGKIWHAAYRE